MNIRTDLAIELLGENKEIDGIKYSEEKIGKVNISRMEIINESGVKSIGKPLGRYVTIEFPSLTEYFRCTDERINIVAKELKRFTDNDGLTLVTGLGNPEITPDALGAEVISNVLATRHISNEISKSIGLDGLNSVAAVGLNVLGKTGIEAEEIILSIVKQIKPSRVIVIDAMASRSLNRLGCTVQISDTGISPGSGIGNARPKIDSKTLGIPVIAIGIPTVVDAFTMLHDYISEKYLQQNSQTLNEKLSPNGNVMIVTPREIDMLIKRAGLLIGMGINCALHPNFSAEDLHSLVS